MSESRESETWARADRVGPIERRLYDLEDRVSVHSARLRALEENPVAVNVYANSRDDVEKAVEDATLADRVAVLEERLGGQSLKITQLGMDAEDDRERLVEVEQRTNVQRVGMATSLRLGAEMEAKIAELEARLVVPQCIPSAWSEIGADPTVTCSPQQEGWEVLPAPTLAARFAALPEPLQAYAVSTRRGIVLGCWGTERCYCWQVRGDVTVSGTTILGRADTGLDAAELIAAHMREREVAE
jgi:hypothetical protein